MTEAATIAPERLATYDHALYGIKGPWRGIVAIVALIVGFFIAGLIFTLPAILFDLAANRITLESLMEGRITMTPLLMLANNLAIASMIPLSLGLQRWIFGVRHANLHSVENRFRWRFMLRLAVFIVPAWAIYVGVSLLLDPQGELKIDATVIVLIVIVLFTTPLQAAGEEYAARGLIQRSVESWIPNSTVAFVVATFVSAGLFCLAHGASDVWLITFYFVLGATLSWVARATGGLEASVLIHTVNNILAFLPIILFGQLDESFDRSAGAGDPSVLISIAVAVIVVAFCWWLAKRLGIVTRAPAPRTVKQEWLDANPPVLEPAAVPAAAVDALDVPSSDPVDQPQAQPRYGEMRDPGAPGAQ